MTVELLDHQQLLSRRALFSAEPRLGWVFRDRWAYFTRFTEPALQPRPLPGRLHRRVLETEHLVRRRLSKALLISAALFVVLGLFLAGAAGDFALSQTSAPLVLLILALVCAAPGAGLTGMALLACRDAREVYELAGRQAREGPERQPPAPDREPPPPSPRRTTRGQPRAGTD
jgi:hypothetical protein